MTKQYQGNIGGIIHGYQKFDPQAFPSPLAPPPDFTSPAIEHALMYGSFRELSEEELARAVRLDPAQFANLGPSLDLLRGLLEERKRKILERYETKAVVKEASRAYHKAYRNVDLPAHLRKLLDRAVNDQQLGDMERIWYRIGDDQSNSALGILQLMERLGDKFQMEQLAEKYHFIGHEPMTVPKGLEIKAELEKIDELLKQLEEAAKSAQVGVIDMEALAEFAEPGDLGQLEELRRQIENYVREMAERQGLDRSSSGRGFQLTPKAYRIFQGKLLQRIFANLQASRTGRHAAVVSGEGAVELQGTKPYEFGDSIANADLTQSVINMMLRQGADRPYQLRGEDLVIHRTRNHPKCATVVIMDMSGSMRYDGQYINVKRMALALQGLISSEFPGDYLKFIEMFTFAKLRQPGELIEVMPKPVTVFDPLVRFRVDMSREDISETEIPPHFTNIQHSLQLARRSLATVDTPNRQVILITDGLPTAHFEGSMLYLMYPADIRTERATLREGAACAQAGITINLFLVPSWSQSREDIRFAYRLAESTKGRVFFTAGRDLDRYVVWDYVSHRREVVG